MPDTTELDVEKFVALQRKQNRIPPEAVLIGFRQGTRKWTGTYAIDGAILSLTGVMHKARAWLAEAARAADQDVLFEADLT